MINKKIKLPFEVIERFAGKNGIPLRDSIFIHERLLVVYLDKAAVSKDSISPNQLVDEAWHSFMLHTKDYARFCNERYGYFIHHVPTGMNRDPYSIKVAKLIEETELEGNQSKDCISPCGKHLCSSDCNPQSGRHTKMQVAETFYNSCSNSNCGNSNCNSDGDAGH